MASTLDSSWDADTLDAALTRLEDVVESLELSLAGDGQERAEALRDRVADDVDGMRARLRDVDAPLLVVFGGVTGAGKSTAVNTLVGERVVATSVLRPTTSTPTLVTAAADLDAFEDGRILPALPRVTGAERDASPGTLRLVSSDALPAGLALVDAPDVDSVREANRDLADALLDAADLWVWFTSAGKYADEESMRYLRRAAFRDTALAVALTQVHGDDAAEIVADFRGKLAVEDLGDVPILVVPYARPQGERLPDAAIAPLRGWLFALADPDERRARRRQTLSGALAALPDEIAPLAQVLDDELVTARRLSDDAARAYAAAERDFAEAVEQGLPLQHEVLNRWNRFVGTGRFLRLAEQASGQARGWVRGLLAAPSTAQEERLEREVRVEVGDTVTGLILQLADLAASTAAESWARDPAGRRLLDAAPHLERSDPSLRGRAERATAAWQQAVVDMVATKGAERRTRARWLSAVINAGATGAIVVALAHTGGLTGAEAGIATAAGAANQTLLVKLLGVQNLRWLIARAKEELAARFAELAQQERRRFTAVLAEAAPDPVQRGQLGDAVAAVSRERV